MTTILVLGGYGGFGARLSRRLAGAGHDVLVAGRSLAKAEAFCAEDARLRPLAVDRDGDLGAVLAAHRPFALIDAAGPFQGLDYRVPEACVAAGCHYIDLADGRAFVAGIGALDAQAKAAGVCVVAGASSVPALSGSVVRELAAGFDEVRAVEMAISASNRATAGPSVTRAIFSYVGRPLALWRGRRWSRGYGWQEMRRQGFVVGVKAIAPRLTALAEVPDLSLLPDRLPGKPAVTFQAGTELAVENVTVWILSWFVRWRWLRNLGAFLPLVLWLKRRTRHMGSDRSAMMVAVFGRAGSRRGERRWTLIAEDGHGPEIPTLAAPILIEQLVGGALSPGAWDAGTGLTLAAFEPAFSTLSIRHAIETIEIGASLYERIMGVDFETLPPVVREMHSVIRDDGASGVAQVTRGSHPLARLVGAAMGFPEAGECALHVHFTERDGAEVWTRDFGSRAFSSRFRQRGRWLTESFGAVHSAFSLLAEPTGLAMRLERWWIGPVPMPLALAPRIAAREWAEGDRFRFDVSVSLPLVGLVVRYDGWLLRKSDNDPSA